MPLPVSSLARERQNDTRRKRREERERESQADVPSLLWRMMPCLVPVLANESAAAASERIACVCERERRLSLCILLAG